MFEEILSYEQIFDLSVERIVLSGVVFKRDFGPWKAGEQVTLITIQDGIMAQLGTYAEGIIRSAHVTIQATSHFLREDD